MTPLVDTVSLGLKPILALSHELIPEAPELRFTDFRTPKQVRVASGAPPTWDLTDVALIPEAVSCFPFAGAWKRT